MIGLNYVHRQRRIRRNRRGPSDYEKQKLFDIIDKGESYPKTNKGLFLQWRDRTALYLNFYCGMRPAEFLNLRWSDIDFNNRTILVQPYFNKQKQGGEAKLTEPATEALKEFNSVCEDLGIHFEFIFPSIESFEPLSVDRGNRIFQKLAKQAGILKVEWITDAGQPKYNYSQYSGRKWYGTQVWRKTKSEAAVQFMLRHKSRLSSEPYIHPDNNDLNQVADFCFKR